MFRLPFTFIATGLIGFGLYHLASLFTAFSYWWETARSPDGWSQAHLLVLGWATMIAMGAVYQLIGVVLQRNIYSEKLGFIQYAFFASGTFGLIYGFREYRIEWIAASATLAFIGILLFAWNVGMTLLLAKKWDTVTISAGCAVLYLVLTGVTGMLMGLNFKYHFADELHQALFETHMWLGTLGWFGLLITGFSYKMLPMFYLAHEVPLKPQKLTLWLWNASVLLGAAALLLEADWWVLAIILTIWLGALITYHQFMRDTAARKHKFPGVGIIWSVWSLRALVLFTAAVVAHVLFWGSEGITELGVSVALTMYLWGWVAVTILGYMSKIVPFLWWTHKYGSKIGQGKVPTMGEMVSEAWVKRLLMVISAAIGVVLGGMALQWGTLAAWGWIVLSIGALVYSGLMARVFTR